MSWQESLLTTEATPWEHAVEDTSAGRWPLDWQLLRYLHNADRIRADKLPILAWALSVDIWDESWPLEKKRSVVRRSIRDHSLKGTIAGVRRYLEIEDSDLVMYIAPPQRTFASRTLTKAEYDAWLAQMPQLRIYLRSRPGDGTGTGFVGEAFIGDGDVGDFARLDEADLIYGRFPMLYQDGELIPLRTGTVERRVENREAIDTDVVGLPGIGGLSFIGVDFVGEAFVEHTVKEALIYTIELRRNYLHDTSALSLNTATPSLTPIRVRFTRESEIGNAGAAAHVGDFIGREFYIRRDEAEWMLYDVIHLLDTTKATPMVDALSFINHARLGIAPFTVELMVDANTKAPNSPAFESEFLGEVFARAEEHSKIERSLDAVALSKGYRDKALVTFQTTRPREWGDGLPLDGSVPIWSRVPATL